MKRPVFQADPAPLVAAAVGLASTAHLVAARGSLQHKSAAGTSFGVGLYPQGVLTLITILLFPGQHVCARYGSMRVFGAPGARRGSALALDGLILVEARLLLANVFTAFSAP